ncbi:hypothetical protein [Alloyangia pacifica]|uniref:hypothetical protein n=1 Tax=Alloyangia pacifica TaxID=311180 RepID=UPI0031D16471
MAQKLPQEAASDRPHAAPTGPWWHPGSAAYASSRVSLELTKNKPALFKGHAIGTIRLDDALRLPAKYMCKALGLANYTTAVCNARDPATSPRVVKRNDMAEARQALQAALVRQFGTPIVRGGGER